jgi:CHASE2 domain-containing sensor protein
MSKPRGFSFSVFYVTVIALLALIAFVFDPIIFLMVFITIVVYLIWNLRNRMKDIEKRLDEKQATNYTHA